MIPHKPTAETRQRVLDLLRAGVTIDRVAEVLDVSYRTLTRHYRAEIDAAGVRSGQAAHVPTDTSRKMVETMAAAGIVQAEIASALEMTERTLRAHYRKELDTASTLMNTKVAENLLRAATGDVTKPATVSAIIWWTKNRMNWSDRSDIDMKVTRPVEELSDEELTRLAARGVDFHDEDR